MSCRDARGRAVKSGACMAHGLQGLKPLKNQVSGNAQASKQPTHASEPEALNPFDRPKTLYSPDVLAPSPYGCFWCCCVLAPPSPESLWHQSSECRGYDYRAPG